MEFRQQVDVPCVNVNVAVSQRFVDSKESLNRSLNIIRHKTMMDLYDTKVFSERPQSLPFTSQSITLEGKIRPQSEMDEVKDTVPNKTRVPILGPTRQQTELYMFRMAKQKLAKLEKLRQAVIPIDGPTHHIEGRLVSGDIAVFDDKAANDVLLEAETQLKSGYPTIATSSMVARRNRLSIEEVDNAADIRFFSDLVKPMQYRWKFQKEKLKTLSPSKHGFHQRSQSPTFQRLVEANEKLRYIAHQESGMEEHFDERDFFDTQSEIVSIKHYPLLRYVQSQPVSERTSHAGSVPATNDTPLQKGYELKPEIRTIEPVKKEKEEFVVQNKILEEKRTPTPVEEAPPTPLPQPKPLKKLQQEFKVDFKKLDSHSELHLFLPHIQDSNSRGATPEEPHRKAKLKFTLPAIEDLEVKTPEEDKSKLKKKQKNEHKRKKKHLHRMKSGKDDKEVTDILNDIPTLISLETDKDFHSESMCMFENCKLHKYRKTNKIRQA